ncbi:ribokinase [Paenibacillus sp. 32O-W]|nr:ribokinase [Paenibacillus sp. 32O-W]
MAKIVVVGSINMDVVIRVPHIPVEGETIMARSVQYYGGGKGANQAIAMSRLGGDVHMIGRVGKDAHGQRLYDNLLENGTKTAGVEWDEDQPSGTAYIYVSDRGENNIVVFSGANSKVDVAQINRYEHLFDDAEYCLMQMEIPRETIEHTVQVCKQKGVKIILNPAPAQPLSEQILEGLYILIPNESELDLLCPGPGSLEEKSAKLYGSGVQNLIVTLGAKGSMLMNEAGVKYFPAVPVKPVDTTAAGDSFIGGLTIGLSNKMDLEAAIQYASLVAAITVSKMGAQASLPDLAAVEAYLAGK